MSISNTNRKAGPFTGNGTASSFPFYFKVFEATDLEVVLLNVATSLETTLTITANYTVNLNANQDATPGGTVTLTAGALASGYKLTITSNIGNLQPTNLTNQGGFYPDVVEDALDRATIQIQQMSETLGRAVTIPISSTASTALPYPQGGTVIGWDDTGSSLVNLSPEDIASQQLYANWKYDTFTGDGTTTQFTLQSNPGNIANMDVSVSGVTQLPGTDYTLSGTTIAFTTAPALGLSILVRYGQATVQTNVTYSQEVFNVTSGTVDVTGKQTIFNLTSSYSPGNNGISVYLNGSRLVGGTDYTETTTTRITLSKGAYPGDVVLIITAEPINANAVDAAQVSYSPAAGAVPTNVQDKLRETVSVKDFGAVGDGVTDDTAAIQAALTYASPYKYEVNFPPGTYMVNSTLSPGDATIIGDGATINYTGSAHCMVAPSVIERINFTGSGSGGTSIGLKSEGGFKNQVIQCSFQNLGIGIEFSGSGQKVQRSYFANCGTGVKIVKYPSPSTDPTTSFTSEKNWYETSTNGLWIDSTGATSGFLSCSSIDDIFQLCQGAGLRLESHTFPFTLINPHTEQNSVTVGWYAFKFVNSAVVQFCGYQAGSINTDYIDGNTYYEKLSYGGIQTQNGFSLSDLSGAKNAFQYFPASDLLDIPAKAGTQNVQFSGGGYNNTYSARFKMYGGIGDNGYDYGNFVESQRTVGIGNGVTFHIGTVTKGASNDTFNRKVSIDYQGNMYPYVDNARSIGTASNRWSVVYAGTGTINTSDEREKQDIADLDAAEKRVAVALKGLVKKFKFKDAVEKKGDAARIHVGVIAQEILAAFEAEGLDATKYGLLCYDEWEATPAELDSDGNIVNPAREAGNRYGIRYEELLAFILAAI